MKTNPDCLENISLKLDKLKGGYQFSFLKDYGVWALFTDKHENFSFRSNVPCLAGRQAARVKQTRKDFLSQVGIESVDLVCVRQVHSSRIVAVTESERGRGAEDFESAIAFSDGLITDIKNLPLAILIADCLAIYFFDPIHNCIGLIHAGWRGSAERISLKLIEIMNEHFGSRAQDLLVGFSPSIRSCCYEVGTQMKDYFPETLIKKEGKLFLDLAFENKNQLLNAGVKPENIIDCGLCTACNNDEFFSYRKEGLLAGRMMAVMMLK